MEECKELLDRIDKFLDSYILILNLYEFLTLYL